MKPPAAGGRRRRRRWRCSRSRGLPAMLILLQPDLGTMLVLSATVFGVIAVSGARRAWLLGLFVGAVGGRDPGGAAAACSRPTRSTASWPSRTPPSTRAAPATTPPRPGSRSATAASSGRASSTARRPARASCPSSTPTSSSPSPARSSAWSASALLIVLLGVVLWRALHDRAARRRPLRPARRGRHRLLVRLPGLPEHRHVPRHHAGHRGPAAVRVVRRHARCSRA